MKNKYYFVAYTYWLNDHYVVSNVIICVHPLLWLGTLSKAIPAVFIVSWQEIDKKLIPEIQAQNYISIEIEEE